MGVAIVRGGGSGVVKGAQGNQTQATSTLTTGVLFVDGFLYARNPHTNSWTRVDQLGSNDALNAIKIGHIPAHPVFATAAANTPVSSTVAGIASRRIVVCTIDPAYVTAGGAGKVVVKDGATTVYSKPITTGGPAPQRPPTGGLLISTGSTLTVTLTAGGVGVVGTLNYSYVVI